MNEPIHANGLTLHHVPTTTTPLSAKTRAELPTTDALTAVVDDSFKTDGFFVAYMDYRVIIGRYVDKKFKFYQQRRGRVRSGSG